MLTVTAIGTIIYASMLVLLCIGFSFTHMIEKFPNFAHISYANIGTIFIYTLVRLMGWNPYASWRARPHPLAGYGRERKRQSDDQRGRR